MRAALVMAALAVAGCGVDGPPVPPSQVEERDGTARGPVVTVSGTAEAGIVVEG